MLKGKIIHTNTVIYKLDCYCDEALLYFALSFSFSFALPPNYVIIFLDSYFRIFPPVRNKYYNLFVWTVWIAFGALRDRSKLTKWKARKRRSGVRWEIKRWQKIWQGKVADRVWRFSLSSVPRNILGVFSSSAVAPAVVRRDRHSPAQNIIIVDGDEVANEEFKLTGVCQRNRIIGRRKWRKNHPHQAHRSMFQCL